MKESLKSIKRLKYLERLKKKYLSSNKFKKIERLYNRELRILGECIEEEKNGGRE